MNSKTPHGNPGIAPATGAMLSSFLPRVLAAAAIVWLATDIVMRLGAHFNAPWMRAPETIAILTLVVGGLIVGLRSRAAKITGTAKTEQHYDANHGSLFHMADGGARLSARPVGKNSRNSAPSTASCDGGIHRRNPAQKK